MGPFNPQSSQGVNVDEIIGAGLEASGVGGPTNTATASTPPVPQPGDPTVGANTQTGRGAQFSVDQPEWAWRPVQQDFGQVDVRRGQYDTGMVPTVNAQQPFAALANRQQAHAERKAALAAKMAAYNPYAGIGKAHDRYQTAFNRYATGQIDAQRKQLAQQMFGGDLAQTDKYLGNDIEGQTMLRRWASNLNAIGEENKAWTDSAIDLLSRVSSGETYVPPDQLKGIVEVASAIGPDGMPVPGVDPSEFLAKQRNMEGKLREVQYIDKVIQPAMADALRTMTGVDISKKRVGGKIILTSTEKKSYDAAIDHLVKNSEDYVDTYYGGDQQAAKKALESYFPTSVKKTVSLESPYTPPASSGADDTKVRVGAVETGRSTGVIEEGAPNPQWTPDPSQKPTLGRADVQRKPVFEMTGQKKVPMGPKNFTDTSGNPVALAPKYIESDADGNIFITGDVAGQQETTTYTALERLPGGKMGNVTKTVGTSKTTTPITLPVVGNEATMIELFGPDYADGFTVREKSSAAAPAKKRMRYNPATGQLE